MQPCTVHTTFYYSFHSLHSSLTSMHMILHPNAHDPTPMHAPCMWSFTPTPVILHPSEHDVSPQHTKSFTPFPLQCTWVPRTRFFPVSTNNVYFKCNSFFFETVDVSYKQVKVTRWGSVILVTQPFFNDRKDGDCTPALAIALLLSWYRGACEEGRVTLNSSPRANDQSRTNVS